MPWGQTIEKHNHAKIIDLKMFLALCIHKICFVAIIILLAYSSRLLAQEGGRSNIEQACRNQAKEVAVTSYNSCMTEGRQKKLDHLKTEYQEKLQDLKSQYDREIQKLSNEPQSKTPSQETFEPAPASQKVRSKDLTTKSLPQKQAPKQASLASKQAKKSIPKTLPKKKSIARVAPSYPTGYPTESTTVVPAEVTEEVIDIQDPMMEYRQAPSVSATRPGMRSEEWGQSYQQFNDEIE